MYWFGKAAEKGYFDAQYKLGHCYENGEGVTENKSHALYYYQKYYQKIVEREEYFKDEIPLLENKIQELTAEGYEAIEPKDEQSNE